jgi:hypothetical protein
MTGRLFCGRAAAVHSGLYAPTFRPFTPGEYVGDAVVRSDPEGACSNPGAREIWGGELQFPIGFTVTRAREQPHCSGKYDR